MGLSDLLAAFALGFGSCVFLMLVSLLVVIEICSIKPDEPTKEEWRMM